MTDKIGFLGLGIMGLGMAENLIRSGRKLVVWNRTTSMAEALCAAHPEGVVTMVSTPGEVAAECNLVYSMLSTLEASRAVFPDLLTSIRKESIIVDCATLTPSRMMEMHAQVEAIGASFLEAPVSGSKKPA